MSNDRNNGRVPEGRLRLVRAAVIVLICMAAACVVWAAVRPVLRNKEMTSAAAELLPASTSALNTVKASDADGSGDAGRQAIPDRLSVQFDTPGWQHDDAGWWYACDEHTYYVNGWATISGKRYHFDGSGYMSVGWTAINGTGYYFNSEGVYQKDADGSKLIALTFDDGPGEYTQDLLDILEENHSAATFFLLGEHVEKYGAECIPRMRELGCQIGNHSYDHPNMKKLSVEEAVQEFQKTDQLIAKFNNGTGASVLRFPYGNYTQEQLKNVGKPSIYWDLDTQDWKEAGTAVLSAQLKKNLSGGNVVLMHDIHETTVETMRTMVPELIREGYRLVTVQELAASRGYTLQDGVTYYGFSDRDSASGRVTDQKTQS